MNVRVLSVSVLWLMVSISAMSQSLFRQPSARLLTMDPLSYAVLHWPDTMPFKYAVVRDVPCTDHHIRKADELLSQLLTNVPTPDHRYIAQHISEYHRQYATALSKDGHELLFLNAFTPANMVAPEQLMGWQVNWMRSIPGARCFQVLFDLTEGRILAKYVDPGLTKCGDNVTEASNP